VSGYVRRNVRQHNSLAIPLVHNLRSLIDFRMQILFGIAAAQFSVLDEKTSSESAKQVLQYNEIGSKR